MTCEISRTPFFIFDFCSALRCCSAVCWVCDHPLRLRGRLLVAEEEPSMLRRVGGSMRTFVIRYSLLFHGPRATHVPHSPSRQLRSMRCGRAEARRQASKPPNQCLSHPVRVLATPTRPSFLPWGVAATLFYQLGDKHLTAAFLSHTEDLLEVSVPSLQSRVSHRLHRGSRRPRRRGTTRVREMQFCTSAVVRGRAEEQEA